MVSDLQVKQTCSQDPEQHNGKYNSHNTAVLKNPQFYKMVFNKLFCGHNLNQLTPYIRRIARIRKNTQGHTTILVSEGIQ